MTGRPRRSPWPSVLLVLGALAALAATVWLAWRTTADIGGADLGARGTLAFVIGALVTIAVGVGLMALVFYSSRRGHDR